MKNKFVLGIFFFLILMTSSVFGSMVENSRQGSPAISAEMHPESTHREPGMLLGLELRFLGFCVRSGIIYTDPFGLLALRLSAGPLSRDGNLIKKTMTFNLEDFPPADPNEQCPEKLGVIQWFNGAGVYGDGQTYAQVPLHGGVKDLNSGGVWMVDTRDTNPLFKNIIIPPAGQAWNDTVQIRLFNYQFPFKYDVTFMTTVVDYEDVKDLSIGTLNANVIRYMLTNPPVKISVGWQLKFEVPTYNASPIETLFRSF